MTAPNIAFVTRTSSADELTQHNPPYVRQIPSDVDDTVSVGAFVPRLDAAYEQSPLEGKVSLLDGPYIGVG